MSTGQVMYYFTSKEHILLETLAWQEHQDTEVRRAALAKITGARWAAGPARSVPGTRQQPISRRGDDARAGRPGPGRAG
jgi:hypothetical protein